MSLKIVLLEPYFTGSHAAWAEGYRKFSRFDVRILKLPGNFWKWRMHGGAITLARLFFEQRLDPDVILASDMLDLTTFLAVTRRRTAGIPAAIYFHENQLTYPWPPEDRDRLQQRDRHYGFINFATALSADAVLFNSRFHRDSFLGELPRMLRHFPDFREMDAVPRIAEKSRILPLGFDFDRLEESRPSKPQHGFSADRPPLVLWNHRWEYDKNPGDFFRVLYAMAERGMDFEVAVLGENFQQSPEVFEQARRRLGPRIVRFGYADSFSQYVSWLWAADVLPVTSHHDFFGVSVVEAAYCGCFPLLPQRLSYPEIFPPEDYPGHFYRNLPDLERKLADALLHAEGLPSPGRLSSHLGRYAWTAVAPLYDKALLALVEGKSHAGRT
jgi:glycosyltransferase involved in cell wall biosynthesis